MNRFQMILQMHVSHVRYFNLYFSAVWLYTLLPDRIQNGFANILAGRRPSLFSYGYSRYGQSSDYPDPDFLEYNLDYNPYDTPRVSESRRSGH